MTLRLAALLLRLAPASLDDRARAEVLDVMRSRLDGAEWRLARALSELFGVVVLIGGSWMDEWRAASAATGTRREGMWESLRQDTRFAWRTLTRNPGYAMAAVTVLALGVGANTAIFSAVNTFFYRPLPFAEEQRLVTIFETNPEFGWEDATAAPANLLDWREQVSAFADVSAYSEFTNRITVFDDGEPSIVAGVAVLGNFFSTLGTSAALGRTFTMDETWSDAAPVVVISHDLWVRRFGSDPDVVGSRMELSDVAPEIIGVMPPGFRFPSATADLWTPIGWDRSARDEVWFRRAHWVRAFARLAPDVTLEEADAQLQTVVQRLQSAYPETNSVMGAGLAPMRDFLIRGVRTQLFVLLGAVGLLLLLACTNVANLMLVRASDRVREVALRRALGAGRGRVARQMLTESGMIALGGGAVGLLLGWIGVRAITATDPLGIDGATSLALDHRVVLFTLAVSALSALVFGSIPASRLGATDVESALRDGGRGHSGGRTLGRTVSVLVTAEVALALLLVVGAGLMVRTFTLLRQVDPGFEREGVVAVRFTVPESRYPERDQVLAFYDDLIRAVEARPGVIGAGTVGELPLNGTSWSSQFQAEGWPPDRVGFEVLHRRADAAYFEAVGTPLVRGRLFGATDGPEDPLVVVVNETFAREHFPGEDPIGQRIAYDRAPTPESNWYEIVGIVADQHQVSPAVPPRAEVFESRDQDWDRNSWFVVRAESTAGDVAGLVREALGELDPLVPVARTEALSDVWSRSVAREVFVLKLLTVFGAVALLLASVGVYGVTAQAARRRTREIGIRMALGADGSDVVRLMLRRGVAVISIGLIVGLAASLVVTRALGSFLFGVEPTDAITLLSVAGLLGSIALAACWLPARRATSVDPVRSLRIE